MLWECQGLLTPAACSRLEVKLDNSRRSTHATDLPSKFAKVRVEARRYERVLFFQTIFTM